jgi:ubiquinone biosynthesis protein UbiJ
MLIAGVIEASLKQMLRLNPEAQQQLPPLNGKVLGIHIEGLDQELYFIAHRQGVDVFSVYEGKPDAMIIGTPAQLASLSRPDAGSRLLAGEARIEGDNATAQAFSKLISPMSIDWEEVLARNIGDIPAHQAGRLFRGSLNWIMGTRGKLHEDIGEYLQEETGLLPSRNEIEAFMDDVSSTRSDADRLEARIQRLEKEQHQ